MKRALLLLALAACRSVAPAPTPAAVTPAGGEAPAALEAVALEPGQSAVTRTALARGQLYLLRASGAGVGGGPALALDVGEELRLPGAGRKPAPPSGRPPAWVVGPRGAYTILTGTGAPRPLRSRAGGRVLLSIFPLTPAPPRLGDPIETVLVPAREKVAVRSAARPAAGAVYLLQAAGEVQVGGPGNLGDAEFHDYRADGSGSNEGEAGVDFGLGVDEPTIPVSTTGPHHPQRRLKWGAFRTDHTYYLLYRGTGEPIGLNYHDSGGRTGVYRDNEGFLPVSIFALP